MTVTSRITHVRRVFDDGVISSTDYSTSEDAINDGVFSAMGAQGTKQVFTDDNGNMSASTGASYLDIEVVDQEQVTSGSGFSWQQTYYTFLWGDSWAYKDPSWGTQTNTGAANALAALAGSSALSSNRIMDTKIILLDPNDPKSGVPVPVTRQLATSSGSGFQWQGTIRSFNNASGNDVSRKQTPKRVVHTESPVTSRTGDSVVAVPDASQYVDMMVVDKYTHSEASGFQWQGTVNNLDNVDYYQRLNVSDTPGDAVVGDNGIDPPWSLDPLQRVVNVRRATAYYAVVWVTASIGYRKTDNPLPEDVNFDPVPFTPAIAGLMDGASVVYQRIFTDQTRTPPITKYAKVGPKQTAVRTDVVIDTFPFGGGIPGGHISMCTSLGEWCAIFPSECDAMGGNITGGPFSTGFIYDTAAEAEAAFVPTGSFSGCYSTPEYYPGVPTFGGIYSEHLVTQTFSSFHVESETQRAADFEAVFLIKLPPVTKPTTKPAFTVKTQGYSTGITVLLYPQYGIKVDTGNTASGKFGNEAPNGRVYIPLNWSSTDKKPPKDPSGLIWPGYKLFQYPPKNDVKNALIFWSETDVNPGSGEQSYKYVITFDKHLINGLPAPSDPPTLYDKSVADKITQLYLDASSSGAAYPFDENFTVYYCDIPYGLVFNPSAADPNGLDPVTFRGPLQKIVKDIAQVFT